jgi:ribose transport system ATP-binding protein
MKTARANCAFLVRFKNRAMENSAEILAASGVWKSYSAVVLSDVSFDLRAGEVHAIVGENGAGKSTLARIMAGLTPSDAGEMRLSGRLYSPGSKTDAERQGVRMVLQELNVIGNLTVAENIFFDQMPNQLGWVDYGRMNAKASEVMAEVGLGEIDPSKPVRLLGVGQQQLVEIAAALSRNCRVLILDEPTAALTDPEIERLFGQIARLKAAGVGLVYISHRMEEILRIADRITVLRDGRLISTRSAGETSMDEIVRAMVGRELGQAVQRQKRTPGLAALRVENLRSGAAVRGVSFQVRCGEILGFAGLMGSGRTETMRAVFGADQPESGEIYLHEQGAPVRIRSPRQAVRKGIALLTEDRKAQGLLLPWPVRANISLMRLGLMSNRAGWVRSDEERNEAARWARALNVRCSSLEQRVVELSGGNQQKVVIAKWLFRNCDILIFDEPTRGIDVGAKFEIYRLLAELADKGKAIIMVSSDLKELLALCDRIAVMSAGRIAATFDRDNWSQEKIMEAALSGYRNSPS